MLRPWERPEYGLTQENELFPPQPLSTAPPPPWASVSWHACLSDRGLNKHTPVINDLTCLCPDMDMGLGGGTGPEDDIMSRTAGALKSYSGPSVSTSSPTLLVCTMCEAVFHCGLDLHFPNDE